MDGRNPPSKHPSILGAGAKEAWPEIWEIIGPQIEHLALGRGATWHENQCVWLNRRGWLEESYWTYSFSPIYDDKMPGRIAGTLSICTETTQQVLYDRRRAFLVSLDDAVRGVSNPRAIIETATEALGRYLQVSRVGFGQVAENGATVHLETSYADGVAPLTGVYPLEGPKAVDVTRLGAQPFRGLAVRSHLVPNSQPWTSDPFFMPKSGETRETLWKANL